ncbi:MAG: nucleotidyl transferase AbiEii/AbiGii toxin family protein [Candidatus Peribacteraceae bacterium]|nr:nucleotidyl transferase AbiEii/AbiGii toxin family protein [Candidatus Peribacteraceae bacterium]
MLDKITDRYLPVISYFCEQHPDFILVGGTALALQKSRRISVDFDLFTMSEFEPEVLRRDLAAAHREITAGFDKIPALLLIGEQDDQLHFAVGKEGLKITLLKFPYKIESEKKYRHIPLATLESIFAMKLIAIRRRVDYKDYYDIATLLEKFDLRQARRFFNKLTAPEKIDFKIILKQLASVRLLDAGVEKSLRGAKLTRKQVVTRIENAIKAIV